jgi:hypothetical protein
MGPGSGSGSGSSGRRRWALAALALAVTALHLGLGRWLQLPGLGGEAPPLRRLEVAFVQELQPAAPPSPPTARAGAPAAVPRPVTAARLLAAGPAGAGTAADAAQASVSAGFDAPEAAGETLSDPPPAPPAFAAPPEREPVVGRDGPQTAQPEPPPGAVPTPEPVPAWAQGPAHALAPTLPPQTEPAPEPAPAPDPDPDPVPIPSPALAAVPPPLAAPDPAAGAAPEPAVPAEPLSGPPFAAAEGADEPGAEWPLSTRLSYVLTGHFRGPVDGQARVDWLRQGARYQVHLDLSVGPFFAPLAGRRLSSEGRITPAGLHPERYEEETRVAFREPRRLRIELGPSRLRLPGGRDSPRPAGVQDSASQFVHMTWLFTLQPGLLQPGTRLELPLALPRSVEPWVYDVVGPDTLHTPIGALPVVHVRPRREPRPGGDLTAEFWVAPSLQYLPVRILIRQSEDVWIDLRLDRLPQQAAGR